ncbi:MAG: serine/threonine protein kinase [Faecousia sp.]
MPQLGPYFLDTELSGKNAGYCMWGFGTRDGRKLFIKQFLSPKYPVDTAGFTEDWVNKRLQECRNFENQKQSIYSVLNEYSDGNDVRVLDFFRIKSRYYMCMEKIEALELSAEDIYKLPLDDRLRLCASIAHAVAGLHKGGLIHADLKHDNVLFTYTQGKRITAKVIDFDSSFLESAAPAPGEEIVGDQIYFSPEAFLSMDGDEVALTCKMDVFALAILFHQYLAGSLPYFDSSAFDYPHDVVLAGEALGLSPELPEELRQLLAQMLSFQPEDRPSSWEVFVRLREAMGCPVNRFDTPAPAPEPAKPGSFYVPSGL